MKTVKKSEDMLNDSSTLSKQKKVTSSRRQFLKKAVYSAPVLMAMGQLLKPTHLQADSTVPPPPPVW